MERVDPRAVRDCYAVVAPGLEALAAAELGALGLPGEGVEVGGVPFSATLARVFEANLELRTVSRVLVRVATFRATAFHELERHARRIDWGAYVAAGGRAAVRVTCKKSRLYHSGAVAQRVEEALARAVPGVELGAPPGDDDDAAPQGSAGSGAGSAAGAGFAGAAGSASGAGFAGAAGSASAEHAAAPPQLFTVRFVDDVCTVSADSSGALLHRRGYRQATAKAPIRETLAAGMLLALGYDGGAPLVDPMCGSGTLAIEAALIARRMAPGLSRTFACERWPALPRAEVRAVRAAASGRVRPAAAALILASDRDAGAVEAARANAARAGVAADVQVERRALSELAPVAPGGFVVVNPPYGERVGSLGSLRNLYAQLGNVARERCAGATIALLATQPELVAQTRLDVSERLRFKNGGLAVRWLSARA